MSETDGTLKKSEYRNDLKQPGNPSCLPCCATAFAPIDFIFIQQIIHDTLLCLLCDQNNGHVWNFEANVKITVHGIRS